MKTILIIEDQAAVRELLAMTLSVEYEALQAATGEEALEKMQRNRPDLVILDLKLNGPLNSSLTGLEVCAILKSSPEYRAIPILILSGSATLEDISDAMLLGAATFVAKPYSPIRLLDIVARLMR